jgi:DHA2 family multidrug resistance protein
VIQSPETKQTNKWIVALTVILPTFIEVMDTSVVNVSLPHIQGSLSAGMDEATWVLTSYLVSNAIIIPITGWLSSVFGRKRYLMFSITLFTLSSLACGAAPSLQMLIVARILQGLGGGGLQPLSQAILLETFPQEEHGLAMAVFGMGVVLAPILGPVVGGWITDNWTWRWVFYINLPAGLLAIVLAFFLIHDPSYIRRARMKIDYWGLSLIAVGLACLQIVLDKGEREDWFASGLIITLSIIAAAALTLFVIVELHTKHPVVNLRVFKDKAFTAGNGIIFFGFFCLFGSFVLLPLYTQNLMGYNATWAGLVMGPGGAASLMVMPIAGALMKKGVKPRFLLSLGLIVMAFSLFLMSKFNLEAGFLHIAAPRFIQGFGIGLFFVPLAGATYMNIPREEMGNASGIFNLIRNLGGSFGVAACATILAQRAQFHQTFLTEHVTPYSESLRMFASRLGEALPGHGIGSNLSDPHFLGVVYQEVLRHANMLAFNDTFRLFAFLTIMLPPLTFFMRRAKGAPPPEPIVGGMH